MNKKDNKMESIKIKSSDLAPFNFENFKDGYLLTNDFGNYVFLGKDDFKNFLEGNLSKHSEVYNKLYREGFIKKDLSEYSSLIKQYRSQKGSLFSGPSLHIAVVTLRCNQNCIYCQASAKSMNDERLDMTIETAKKTVDTIFETASDYITIEFQGGEPLANWEVVKYIVDYAKEKNKELKKEVHFSLVSNLSLMTEERLDFIAENLIGICTSLDGPENIHNKNRPFPNKNSYQETIKWINLYNKKRKDLIRKNKILTKINALVTLSKYSLDYSKEIIDEYVGLGFTGIHLRPLSYLGYSAGSFKEKMGYSTEDFLDFWKKSLDYIIEINKNGTYFSERETQFRLKKILSKKDPGYTDLSSPCGAVIGQMLYNYNGNVYTCDEGRMVEEDIFKIGEIGKDSYEDMINSETTQAMMTCSILDNLPCNYCVYKPFCGVCPVKNYNEYGNLVPQIRNTEWCKLQMGQFEYIFSKLQNKEEKEIFKKWADLKF